MPLFYARFFLFFSLFSSVSCLRRFWRSSSSSFARATGSRVLFFRVALQVVLAGERRVAPFHLALEPCALVPGLRVALQIGFEAEALVACWAFEA